MEPTMTPRQIVDITLLAVEFFSGDTKKARTWLYAGNKALGGTKPINSQYEVVKNEIGKMTHGIFA